MFLSDPSRRPPARSPDDGGVDNGRAHDLRELVSTVIEVVGRAGTITAAGVSDAVEGAGRALARRRVDAALDDSEAVADPALLAELLEQGPVTPMLGNATVAAFAARAASRVRPLGFLSRRTPLWIMAVGVPALVASVSRGAYELDLVAGYLAQRARVAGVEPDPERIRRAAVQVADHRTVDPEDEPSHAGLVLRWIRRAVRGALPFSQGIRSGDAEGMVQQASQIDPIALGAG